MKQDPRLDLCLECPKILIYSPEGAIKMNAMASNPIQRNIQAVAQSNKDRALAYRPCDLLQVPSVPHSAPGGSSGTLSAKVRQGIASFALVSNMAVSPELSPVRSKPQRRGFLPQCHEIDMCMEVVRICVKLIYCNHTHCYPNKRQNHFSRIHVRLPVLQNTYILQRLLP